MKQRLSMALIAAASVIILSATGCGSDKSNKYGIRELPSLQPPPPPKAPSMAGADTIWDFSDRMPVLPGNEEALFSYIGKTLRYPEAAAREGVEGKVLIRFCVTSKGDVTGHEIIGSVDSRLDAEAMRVLKSIKRFEPGYNEGKAVPVWYEVPITFRLK